MTPWNGPAAPPRFDDRPEVWHSTRTGPLRLALVGLVHQHAEGLLWQAARRDDLEVVGVCEPNVALFERLADEHGLDRARRHDDLETMLRETQPEAASIMTSTADHAAVVEVCARSGVHVLVEKPLAFRAADADRMARAAHEHGILVLTNYETSWYASVRETAKLIGMDGMGLHLGGAGGRSAPPFHRLTFRHGHPGPLEIGCYGEFTDWLTDPERSGGGALVDFGCYGAVLSTWLMRGVRPNRVVASAQTLKPRSYPRVDDDATIVLEYDGASAVLQASWAWTHDCKEMDVFASKGSLHAARWDRLVFRAPDGVPAALDVPVLPGHMKDEWTYLRHVVRGRCRVDALSSLEYNRIVADILDEARRQVRR